MEYLKRAEVCRKQFALQKKMDEGDSDITVCFKCERLFKQDMAPCTHCRGCRQFLPEGQALAHKKLYKEFNRIYGCSAKKAAEINSRRAVMIHQIRKTMPEIQELLSQIQEEITRLVMDLSGETALGVVDLLKPIANTLDYVPNIEMLTKA